MLDDFSNEQIIAYKILKKSLEKNKCSHAYLIEANGYPSSLEFAISFAKSLLCPYKYTTFGRCSNCYQCKTIDDNNFIELKIIRPDGEWIKKEQLDELQKLFSKKAVIGDKKVYIIDGIEKLNISAANSILKFLEEPEDGIIAILVTENINNVLNTIISRCQLIKLVNSKNKYLLSHQSDNIVLRKVANIIFNNKQKIDEFIQDEKSLKKIENSINFINYYEENHLLTLLEIENLWNEHFSERSEVLFAFKIMVLYYEDILNYIINRPLAIFDSYKKDIQKIAIKENIEQISKKIRIIIELKDKIKYNINTNLLMDKLLLELEGGV